MKSTEIESDESLLEIEHHFRVTAGPGSGKTHWLTNHIRDVTRRSDRLTSVSKIAVISHTNVAVRELLSRLGNTSGSTEISTIHSFLYRNLVRPYLHLMPALLNNTPIMHQDVTGHDEHLPHTNKVHDWLAANNKRQLTISERKSAYNELLKCLRSVSTQIDSTGQAEFTVGKAPFSNEVKELLTPSRLLQYKALYWKSGQISHEDVIFFSHHLLRANPELAGFLAARFPYLFIDEYQDTTSIPAAVVSWMADAGTVVGVIGDPAQSIFGFAGASRTHFQDFSLPGQRDYSILGNRRSTSSLVSVLNRVRSDGLLQQYRRTKPGPKPIFLSGDLSAAIYQAKCHFGVDDSLLCLARSHTDVASIRLAMGDAKTNPWKRLNASEFDRPRFLSVLAESISLSEQDMFDLAVRRVVAVSSSSRKMRKPFGGDAEVSKLFRNGFGMSLLEFAINRRSAVSDESCLSLFNALREFVLGRYPSITLAKPNKSGGFYQAADKILFRDLLSTVRTTEETRRTRTIHQAKGTESKACFVLLREAAIEHLLNPSPDNEEHRITYVALSRACDCLAVYCESIGKVEQLRSLGFDVLASK
ncbi:UvrD-helicase domain-containing protein [Novipirellula sp. SH528]|uniref:UvrD-helicase domain-containing protein n=1 Tax=Novipirellula sp. SH528 TaxID=3454466 RepID=UPI003FA12DBC